MPMELKQVIIIRSDLKMGKGKIASQASHASISAFIKAQEKFKDWTTEWLPFQKKIVLKADLDTMLKIFTEAKQLLPCVLIKDAGRTQIAPGSITAIGIGPAPEDLINRFTKDLKLL